MMIKLLHALAAFLTIVFYLLRRRRVCQTKRSSDSGFQLFSSTPGDCYDTSVQECAHDSLECAVCIMPRYKRDPIIEEFTVPPCD